MAEQCKCSSCGGVTERRGNFYVCLYCDTKWAIITEDAMQVKLQNAWEALRNNEFDKASELFEGIIIDNNNANRNSDSFEAYWGKALADNGIVFVNDYREDKKVPTCNNITENSFVENPDVKKAIALAPKDVSDNYSALAEKIEKIRVEWLEKARKEEPYDVFICFKDSDKENNIDRTKDSYAAQEIYTELVKEGYKVFFSRVSLRDKISEQYEPYIYNALKTAKVMIVYGEKPEYFNAVWLRNEWNRFRIRIEKGEKHKNSLVVVYKNMDANDLPAALKSRQCLNAGDMMFYSTLSNHVKKVIELSSQNVHLDRIKIQGGQMGKKASQISVNSVKTREIGEGAIAETDISEKQSIALINTYLRASDWRAAKKLVEDVLFDNPGCAEALWCQILANSQVTDEADFCKKLTSTSAKFNDFALLEKLLNCASKEFATKILNLFYDINFVDDDLHHSVLSHILPFAYAQRDAKIKASFDKAIAGVHQKTFDLLLGTLASNEVDRYIAYNQAIVKATDDLSTKRKYLNNILSVDEGNVSALRMSVEVDILTVTPMSKIKADFETLLKYTDNADKEVVFAIDTVLSKNCVLNSDSIAFTKDVLRYYNGNIADLKNKLMMFADKLIKVGCKNDAEYYCNLVLSVDKACADAYWNLCLIKIGARSENDIPNCTVPIKSCSEFNKYLTLVDEERRMKCIQLSQKQKNIADKNKNDNIDRINKKIIDAKIDKSKYQDEIKKNKQTISAKVKEYRKEVKLKKIFSFIILLLIVGLAVCAFVVDLALQGYLGDFIFTDYIGVIGTVGYIGFLSSYIYSIYCVYLAVKNAAATVFISFFIPIVFFFPMGVWISMFKKFKAENDKLLEENKNIEQKIIAEEQNIRKLEEELEKVKATKIEY